MIKQISDNSVDLIITSPPYWAKRIYNGYGELGLEATPEEYVNRLTSFFDKLSPILKQEGNLFVNIGDTFFGSGAGAWNKPPNESNRKEKYQPLKPLQPKIKQNGKLYQNKQLLLIPSRFAIEMQKHGWILRDDIIWRKPNRIPSGVKDRFINTYEHVFHFVKNRKYFFDLDSVKTIGQNGNRKNPGDVWDINTQPLKETTHTASFPEELVRRIIKCGSPQNGIVLDPFLGTGTTWVVCEELKRNCIGFEINKEFYEYAQSRFNNQRKEMID